MAHYELFHLDLHCLQNYLFWSAMAEKVKGYIGMFCSVFTYICALEQVYIRINFKFTVFRFSE